MTRQSKQAPPPRFERVLVRSDPKELFQNVVVTRVNLQNIQPAELPAVSQHLNQILKAPEPVQETLNTIRETAMETWVTAGFQAFEGWPRLEMKGGWGTPIHLVEERPYSPEWYAARVLGYIFEIERSLTAGHTGEAVQAGMRLGHTIAEANLRDAWGDSVVKHRRTIEGGKKGNRAANPPKKLAARQKQQARWKYLAATFRQDEPGLSDREIARLVAERTGGKPDTIRKALRSAG